MHVVYVQTYILPNIENIIIVFYILWIHTHIYIYTHFSFFQRSGCVFVGYIFFQKNLWIHHLLFRKDLRLRERAGEALRAAAARRAEVGWLDGSMENDGRWTWNYMDDIYIYMCYILYIYIFFFFLKIYICILDIYLLYALFFCKYKTI